MPEWKGTGVPWNPSTEKFNHKEQGMKCDHCGEEIMGGFYQDDEIRKGWTLGGIFCSEECLKVELEDAISYERERK